MSEHRVTPATVAERARLAITESGLVQREVAQRTGIEESKLSKSLNGTRRFTALEIVQLATVTGITASWLMTGSDSGPVLGKGNATELLPARPKESERQALRRRNIVESAWWLFAERGFDNVRIADIAQKSGLSTPSVHYYFATKHEIFAEALRFSFKLAYDRQVAELQEISDPLQRLKRLVELQLPDGEYERAEWSIWLQTWVKLSVGEKGLAAHTPGYGRWNDIVRETIVAGQVSGHFISEDPTILATELTALFDGMGIKVLTGLLTPAQMHQLVCRYIDRNLLKH